MWEPEKAELLKAAAIDESLSALAVRDDGRFVAIGTMFSGSISIYIAFSLQVKQPLLKNTTTHDLNPTQVITK